MKQLIIIIGIGIVIMLASMSVLSIEGKTERRTELERAVSTAVKQTVSYSQIQEQKEITSNDEMIAFFIQLLATNLNAECDVEIEIMGVDYMEGMLDVMVTERFNYINGNDGSIRVRKCAISES